jgi:folate-dependent tRNA-U54 methylase TrmFO/GidA
MNANFGLVEAIDHEVRDKRRKKELMAERALADVKSWREGVDSVTPAAAS